VELIQIIREQKGFLHMAKKKTTKKKTPPQGLDDRRVIRSS